MVFDEIFVVVLGFDVFFSVIFVVQDFNDFQNNVDCSQNCNGKCGGCGCERGNDKFGV